MKPQLTIGTGSLIAFSILIFCSCNNSQTSKQLGSEFTRQNLVEAPANSLFGSYVGLFEADKRMKVYDKEQDDSIELQPNKITLFIQKMNDGHIEGWSVCAGNDRPFKGTYTEEKDLIKGT